jgi:hypothetical protein
VSARPIDARAKAAQGMLEWAAAKGDADAALSAVREALRICDEDRAYRLLALVPGSSDAPSFGRPFPARYAGRCVMCDAPIAQGAEAVYRSADKAIAHVGCGGGR